MHQAKKLFGDRIHADVIFELKGKEKRSFYAHSCIIYARCDSLLTSKAKETLSSRKKAKAITIEIKEERGVNGPNAFSALLEYLYTGIVRFPSLNTHDVIELYSCAELYKQDRLKWLAKKHFVDGLKSENIVEMLKAADELKNVTLKAHAMAFALDNYNSFIADKNGAKILGVELFSEVVSASTSRPAAPPIEDEPPERLREHFKEICDKMIFPDALAVCAKGDKAYFHKAILAAHSDVFAQMFAKDEPMWDFKSLTADAFRAMLRYLYYGEAEISSVNACELLPMSRHVVLPDLQAICQKKLGTNVTVENAVEILKQTCNPNEDNYRDVKENAIGFTAQNIAKINIKELREINVNQAHYIACELLTAYQNIKKYGTPTNPNAPPTAMSPRAGSAPLVAPPSLATPNLDSSRKKGK